MAGNILWQSGAIQSLGIQASGQGNQLTNGSAVALGTNLDNRGLSGGPAYFANAELLLAQSGFGAAAAANQEIEFYLVASRDGTNFPNVDAAGAVMPAGFYRGSFITTVSGNNQGRMGIEAIPLSPALYKGYVINRTGQTMASGWGITVDLFEDAYT